MKVNIIERDDLQQQIAKSLQQLSKLTADGSRISRMPDGSFQVSNLSSATLHTLNGRENIDIVVRDLVKSACKKAEKFGPGASELLINFASNLAANANQMGMSLHQINKLGAKSSNVIESLVESSRHPSIESMKDIILRITNDEYVSELIKHAIDLAGSECKIFIEATPSTKTTIERILGFNFHLKPNSTFYESGFWKYENVKCFIVDGIIENVSEVDTLFQKCSEKKQPIAIFARGFKPDVIATMRVNWLRKTLLCIPISVDFAYETINVLNDIATIAGGDVISSLKGQLISTVSFDSLPVIQSLSCKGPTVTLRNDVSIDRVTRHVQYLREKHASSEIEDTRIILDKRIRSMSGMTVFIRLASKNAADHTIKSQNLDIAMRLVSSILRMGSIKKSDLESNWKEKELDIIKQSLLDASKNNWHLPTVTVASILKQGTSLVQTLTGTGAMLLKDSTVS